MNRKFFFIALIWILGGMIISACSGPIPVSGDPQSVKATQDAAIAQAAMATVTQSALETELAHLRTQVAQITAVSQATATPVPPSPTPTQAPPTATATPVLPTATATATPLPCNMAEFVADVSIPDGTVLSPGTSFAKIWRLKNIGACTWTTGYTLIFVDGDRLGGPVGVAMPADVLPGQVIDLSVDLVAPAGEGSYRGNWKLRDASGVQFGLGRRGSAFYVDIQVAVPQSSNPLDFVANYCLAEWTSGAGRLPCQGGNNDSRGFVRRVDKPTLESGYIDDEPVLLTQPQMITDGVIRGKYPSVAVEQGYHFVSIIGCAYKATGCDVNFQLDYQIGSGSIHTLATWNETLDGEFNLVDVDLSSLAGNNVKFILTVLSNGSPNQDRAQWLAPHISKGD